MKTTIAVMLALMTVMLPICFADTLNLQYDSVGNLVTGDGFYREYNSLNQLSRIRLLNSTGIVLETYVYDPVEEKVLLKNVSYTNGTWKETVYYWFDEYVEVNNASGWFNFTYVEQDGVRVAELRGNIPYYILDDHLGSSTVITNASGAVIENTSYTPFGSIISGGTQSRYDYTGQEFDSVIGDYDYHARRYKSDWGKFLQPDTLLPNVYDPQQLNRYAYVRNNPWKNIDPSGHEGLPIQLNKYSYDINAIKSTWKDLSNGFNNAINSIPGHEYLQNAIECKSDLYVKTIDYTFAEATYRVDKSLFPDGISDEELHRKLAGLYYAGLSSAADTAVEKSTEKVVGKTPVIGLISYGICILTGKGIVENLVTSFNSIGSGLQEIINKIMQNSNKSTGGSKNTQQTNTKNTNTQVTKHDSANKKGSYYY